MSVRRLIRDALMAHPGWPQEINDVLTSSLAEASAEGAFVPERGYGDFDPMFGSSAVDTQPQLRPFMTIRLAGGLPSVSRRPMPRLEIWVHDDAGSYLLVDKVLQFLMSVVPELPPLGDPKVGSYVSHLEWQSNSPDLNDSTLGTICRMASFQIVGKDLYND